MLRLGQRDRQGESSSAYAMAVDLRSILELMRGGIFTIKDADTEDQRTRVSADQDECSGG
jgi:hypothetical protein